MVSFQCDGCADTVKKPKLDQHRQRCWASFTCLDCSKTFQNQEYKSHTSCISEAEKYQGALYKGPRKGQQNQQQQQQQQQHPSNPASALVAEISTTTPIESAASSPAPPAIHPSRLQQVDTATSGYQPPPYSRGGRGGSFRGRGGFGNAPVAPPRGSKRNPLVSGENKAIPSTGMRSWGSPVVTESETATLVDYGIDASSSSTAPPKAYMNGAVEGEKKKRRKKGDKGGTGSKANSKRPKDDDAETVAPVAAAPPVDVEPAAKKRKRSASPSEVAQPVSAEISDKTLKRLRKNAAKVAEKSQSLSLGDWLKQVGDAKKEQVDAGDVNRAAKVSWDDGKWVLTF